MSFLWKLVLPRCSHPTPESQSISQMTTMALLCFGQYLIDTCLNGGTFFVLSFIASIFIPWRIIIVLVVIELKWVKVFVPKVEFSFSLSNSSDSLSSCQSLKWAFLSFWPIYPHVSGTTSKASIPPEQSIQSCLYLGWDDCAIFLCIAFPLDLEWTVRCKPIVWGRDQ